MKMKLTEVIIAALLRILLLDIISLSSGQQNQCAHGEFPPWPRISFGDGSDRISRRTQVILPRYEVSCAGNVTEWHVDLSHRGEYEVGLQVWRQSPSSQSRCYSLVESNILSTSISRRSLVTLNLRDTPASQISVQPSDVVGFSVIDAPTGDSQGVNVHPDHTAMMILATSTVVNGENFCTSETMSSKAPVISVLVETSTVVPTSTTQPLPLLTTSTVMPTPEFSSDSISSTFNGAPSLQPTISATVATTKRSSIATPIIIVLVLLCLVIIVAVVVIAMVIGIRKKKSRGKSSLNNPNYDGTKLNTISYSTVKEQVAIYEDPDTTSSHNYAYIETTPSKRLLPHHNTKTKSSYSHTGPTLDQPVKHKVNVGHDYDEMQFQDDDDSYQDPNYRTHTLEVSDSPPVGEYELEMIYEETAVDSDPVYVANIEVFDSAGVLVPTAKQRTQLVEGHYDIGDNKIYNKTAFFVEDQDYWAPANTAPALYEQLAAKKYREIPRQQISTHDQLGSGQFGEVFKGSWTVSGVKLDVAIKMLRSQSSEEDKVKFLQEAAIMGQFMHKNVVKLYGVVTVGEPVMICLEMLKNGDLRQYLNKIERSTDVLQHRFLKFAREIAAGMNYLSSSKSFVHRDLAARNILLNDTLTCKIGDFGMARDLMEDTYYTSKGGKIPVKWTAPEALFYKKYSTDSDVWSYGMVLFEIWSVGRKPFSLLTNKEVLKRIQNGYCQAPPPGCPRPIYEVMVNCWHPEHEHRPKFNELCSTLKQSPAHLVTLDQLGPSFSPKANILGEELEHGRQLYLDLQHKYHND